MREQLNSLVDRPIHGFLRSAQDVSGPQTWTWASPRLAYFAENLNNHVRMGGCRSFEDLTADGFVAHSRATVRLSAASFITR